MKTKLMEVYLVADKKERRGIDKRYKEFIAYKPCIGSFSSAIHLHHYRSNALPAPFGAGVGMKPAFIMALPLRYDIHNGNHPHSIHRIGNTKFEDHFKIDLKLRIERFHDEFMELL